MKALLMHPDRDFDLKQELPWNAEALIQDLELNTLLRAMANDDEFLFEVSRKALLAGLKSDLTTIRYRQEILKDCLNNPDVVRETYGLAVKATTAKRKGYFGVFGNFPASILHGSMETMRMLVGVLRDLRGVADEHAARFESAGFKIFWAMLMRELSDDYLGQIEAHLEDLEFRDGVLLSAELGQGNEVANCMLRKAHGKRQSWLEKLLRRGPPGYTVVIAERDEAGARYLSELKDRGINLVASALAQSTDHIVSFFEMLRAELGFYAGCLNLHGRLASMEEPTCFPQPQPAAERKFRFREMYDVCLALTMARKVVANAVDADGKGLLVITGANQGGKSSFLRGIGLAQLMMQCGMYVGAEFLEAGLCTDLFTHYRREEDATMESGRLDEELGRMSGIVDRITPDAMLLFNESFAATNEREGSEIARQVVTALLEKRIRVCFVTHLFEFAHGIFARSLEGTLFLRAERRSDGTRTFKIEPGEPMETSHGEDLYREVFGAEVARAG